MLRVKNKTKQNKNEDESLTNYSIPYTRNSSQPLCQTPCVVLQHFSMSVEGYLPQDERFATRVVHSGLDETEVPHGAVVPPITLSSTYCMKPGGKWDVSSTGQNAGRRCTPSRNYVEMAACFTIRLFFRICCLFPSGYFSRQHEKFKNEWVEK